jgi:hypothetical protein
VSSRKRQILEGAFSRQLSAKSLFLMSFAESLTLMADRLNPKTTVFGWTLTE